jgi:hypothetical protein
MPEPRHAAAGGSRARASVSRKGAVIAPTPDPVLSAEEQEKVRREWEAERDRLDRVLSFQPDFMSHAEKSVHLMERLVERAQVAASMAATAGDWRAHARGAAQAARVCSLLQQFRKDFGWYTIHKDEVDDLLDIKDTAVSLRAQELRDGSHKVDSAMSELWRSDRSGLQCTDQGTVR